MPQWGDNGVTIARQLLDQQVVASGWASSQLKIPFKALRTAGYLRKFRIWSPSTVTVVTHGTGTNAQPASAQLPSWRTLNRVQLQMQGIANLWDVQGLDFPYLEVMNMGDSLTGDNEIYNVSGTGGTANANGGNATSNYLTNSTFSANTSVSTTAMYDCPMTEKITFRDSVVAQKSGSVVVADKDIEIGLLTLQNTQSNVLPVITLNPLFGTGANNVDVQVVLSGNDTVATANPAWNISSDLFDVPDDPSQRPLPFQQAFVITRSTFDTVAAGAASTTVVNFRPAGFLVRYHALVLDTNNNTIDIVGSGAMQGSTVDFKWGSTVSKFTETIQENASRQFARCVGVPPQGAFYHDFMWYDGTATDYVNTAILPNVRTEIRSTTAATTTVRTCETRLIPIKVS